MAKQEHPYAHVLRWIADGENVQMRTHGVNRFVDTDTSLILYELADNNGYEFRIKPRTIMIGDVECEAPIKELAKGEACYLLRLPGEELKRPAQAYMHQNNIESAVSKGVMFATPEAALAAGIAVSKLLTQE